MAKLYFRYGTMDSAKTLNLLAVAHNYKKQGKRCILLKPSYDDRFGAEMIRSRAGLEAAADHLVGETLELSDEVLQNLDCIVVDEAQFLKAAVIDALREISIAKNIPVICYGLRTDFRSHLFEGSRRLFELADSIEEVKVTCHACGKKAVFNLRLVGEAPVFDGPQLQLGGDEAYVPVCAPHYRDAVRQAAERDAALERRNATFNESNVAPPG